MRTIWDPADFDNLMQRAGVLTDDRPGLWGAMTCAQMLRHLTLAARMATGELAIPRRKTVLSRFPLKQLILYVLPFPKGAPTAPELRIREELTVDGELPAWRAAMEALRSRPRDGSWPPHPAFGELTGKAWGALVWKHCDHHLQQFGA